MNHPSTAHHESATREVAPWQDDELPGAEHVQVPIEDYGLLADRRTAALVSREGSMDWLCLPRFDSDAIFCALLGDEDNGRWLMRPRDGEVVQRRYEGDSFVLVTTWRTPTGELEVTEFMPHERGEDGHELADVVRRVRCTRGTVELEHRLTLRFRYGASRPWMHRAVDEGGQTALVGISGPGAVVLHGPDLHAAENHHVGRFELTEGDQLDWVLTWFPSHRPAPASIDVDAALAATLEDWHSFAVPLLDHVEHPTVRRSLLVLRALTHAETGGIVAAPTTSLPEEVGGERNWDYRYVWLRDSAMTLAVMVHHGLAERMWRDWLLRAVASDHDDLQIMYGVGAERVDDEKELDHLAGYWGSRPVRVGNGATSQYQADVLGEVMLALQRMRRSGIDDDRFSWSLQATLLDDALAKLDEKDHGIWEMRGELQYFTHGRVMMWAAFDCGIRAVEEFDLPAEPERVERWRIARDELAKEVWQKGFDEQLNSFTQTYSNDEVDASLLTLTDTGFIAADDPRMLGTVARIEADLLDEDGLVHRYRTEAGMDGLKGDESPFLMCTYWLVTQYARSGELDKAQQLFDHTTSLASELGLMAEEYDSTSGHHIGNYPQAFSHLGLVSADTAIRIAREHGGCTAEQEDRGGIQRK